MKLNIAFPRTGNQKMIEVDDERKLRAFYDKRISDLVEGDVLGDEFKGYVFKITGGNDLQGFPMMQGVLSLKRVKLLLRKGSKCYRQRRKGERKKKSVRGCIVGPDMSVLSLVIVQKGESEIAGLTDEVKPRRKGPKRASKIASLFNLGDKWTEAEVRSKVYDHLRRQIVVEGKKSYYKAPKVQRLVTPQRLQHKRREVCVKRARWMKANEDAKEYNTKLAQVHKDTRERRLSYVQRRRQSSRHKSEKKVEA